MLNFHVHSGIGVLVLVDLNLAPSSGNDRTGSHGEFLDCLRDSTEQSERQTNYIELSHRTSVLKFTLRFVDLG